LFLVGKQALPQTLSLNNASWNKHHLRFVLWGATTCSLAFFLAGFQVHEKSILFPLAPLSLVVMDNNNNNNNQTLFVNWFSMVAVWTLWPLMIVDKLQLAYICCCTIYLIASWMMMCRPWQHPSSSSTIIRTTTTMFYSIIYQLTNSVIIPISTIVMILLHILEKIVTSPKHLPDLFPVLWSIAGCAMFLWSYIYCLAYLGEMYYSIVNIATPNVNSRIKRKQS
jgi:alpha-1,3-glucosyltransferase